MKNYELVLGALGPQQQEVMARVQQRTGGGQAEQGLQVEPEVTQGLLPGGDGNQNGGPTKDRHQNEDITLGERSQRRSLVEQELVLERPPTVPSSPSAEKYRASLAIFGKGAG